MLYTAKPGGDRVGRAEFYDINGKRFTEAEIRDRCVVEYRCEVCGEFVAETAMVTVQNAMLFTWTDPPVYVPTMYFHPEHTPADMVPFLTKGR
jgi:hypothetical protein